MKLPENILNKIYDVLEEYTGALPWNRDDFVQYFTTNLKAKEYRGCDKLGFGGKFWNNNGKLYVTCYPEDEDDERYVIIEKVNKILDDILTDYLTNIPEK